ncbi:TadE family type IV pilus minor pilin [Amycolatopsis anabasis]|uniref:TadE family type IV pilus minor pilin n=1 Tax=Amycolatopsis anabasis TaxID=1840409 RepID=UPI00131B1753|nr:TadE family type IV pilus minor pilin [Amycolatopsis anabasis]
MAARGDPERGAVTVEAAIAVGALIFVLGMALAALVAMADQLRCVDAAREAARLVARGDRQLADQAVAEIAPAGARLAVRTESGTVEIEVRAAPAGGLLPGVELRGSAYAVLEPEPEAPGAPP